MIARSISTSSLALALAACAGKGADSGACASGGTGTLSLTAKHVDGQWISAPAVDVHDSSGALAGTLTATGTLDVPGGTYTISVRRGVAAPDQYAGSASGLLTGTVSEVCIPDGGTTDLTVDAQPQPSSARMWGISGEDLAGYPGISDPGATVQADAVLSFPNTNDLRGAAWDPWGNLWAISSPTYGVRFLVVEPQDITGKGDAKVLHEVTSSALDSAQVEDLVPDAEGNLWVTVASRDDGFAGVLVYSVDDLRNSFLGTTDLTPARSWTVTGATAPSRAYFDADAGFYLSDPGTDTVFHVPAVGAISGTSPVAPADGALTPDTAFTSYTDDGTGPRGLSYPADMALDSTGLWVLYQTSGIVAHLSRSANGDVQSNFTYGLGVLALPSGLVRDGGNGMWVGNDPQTGAGDLQRFDPTDGTLSLETGLPDLPSPVQFVFDPPVPLPG